MDEKEILNNFKITHGYEADLVPTQLTSTLVDFAVQFAQTDYGDFSIVSKKSTKKAEIEKSKQFLERYFCLHHVPFLKSKDLRKLHHKEVRSMEELVLLYNRVGCSVSPFTIPILYVAADPFYGILSKHVPICDDSIFLANMKLYIENIRLSQTITALTGLSYTHEIVHTQLERERGIIKNYKYTEVLSVFLEFVYCYDLFPADVLKRIELRRMHYFLVEFDSVFKYYYENDGTIPTTRALMSSKYLESILIAFRLFLLYFQGNVSIKKEMLRCIQKVFDGDICLEEFLALYGITFENSIDESVFKHLLRK